jgi:hypothetical protein
VDGQVAEGPLGDDMITGDEGLGSEPALTPAQAKKLVPADTPVPDLDAVIDAALSLPPMGSVPFTYPAAAGHVAAILCMEETAANFEFAWPTLPRWLQDAIPESHISLPARISYEERRVIYRLEALKLLAGG